MRTLAKFSGLTASLVVAWSGIAVALWSSGGLGAVGAQANTLQAPGTASSIHPNVTGTTAGHVALTWAASPSSFATGYEVQRAPAPCSPPTWATVATVIGTSYTDTTAAYNQQYCYRVVAKVHGWSAAGTVNMALSLPPTSGTDATGTSAAGISATSLTNLSTSNTSRYTTATAWAAQPQLNSVRFLNSTQGWAVGSSGRIVATTNGGSTWTVQSSGTTNTLYGLAAFDATHAWAVGQGGVIRFFNGTSWVSQTSGVTTDLYAVTFVSATQGWAVGAGGVIRTTTNGGATWTSQASGTTAALMGVAAVDSTRVWISGAGGTIRFFNGSTWAGQTSGTTSGLNGIAFLNASQGWAVGAAGTIRTTNDGGVTWTGQTSGTTTTLYGVHARDGSNVWAVGAGGTIRYFNGIAWATQTSANADDLQSVAVASSMTGWAVGRLGTIVRTTTTGSGWVLQPQRYLESISTPTVVTGAAMTSVKATLTYRSSATPASGTAFNLLVSVDDGGSWTPRPLTPLTAQNTDITATVDLTGLVTTPAELQSMRLRFVATLASGSFTTSHDLIHVDVN